MGRPTPLAYSSSSSSSSSHSQPPRLRRILPIALPPVEEPNPYVHFPHDIQQPIVDPEVRDFLHTVDWHLSLGPRNIPRWHPLLDRRLFLSNPTSSSFLHSQMKILIHVYTPGRRLPAPHTSRLSIRVYHYARVRDLFYEICDHLGAAVVPSTLASLSGDDRRKIIAAQTLRVGEGFTEIGTTSIRSTDDTPIVFADFLDMDFVLSDLTPIYATDGTFSLSVLFKT